MVALGQGVRSASPVPGLWWTGTPMEPVISTDDLVGGATGGRGIVKAPRKRKKPRLRPLVPRWLEYVECPFCHEEFILDDWREFFVSGRLHTCDACGKDFEILWRFWSRRPAGIRRNAV